MSNLNNPNLLAMSVSSGEAPAAASKQSSDDDDSSQSAKNGNHSRLGRKGDPRMHKAVAARLANPTLSLIESLRIGGFNYPEDPHDHYCLENDTVSLGQRKNQLSRRCRLAKQRSPGGSTSKRRKKSKSNGVDEMQDSEPRTRGQKRELALAEAELMDEEAAQARAAQRMAKFHPQYHPIIIPPAHVPLGTIVVNQDPATLASTNASTQQQNSGSAQSSLLAESLIHPKAHPSGVAVASLTATASSVGLSLEQLAVSLSTSTTLSKVLVENDPDVKQHLAFNLFRSECSSLYQKCMLLAGYNAEETQPTSLAYKEFAYKAWSAEGKRLESHLGRMADPPPSPPAYLDQKETTSEKVPAAAKRNAIDDHSSSNEEGCGTCINGRHLHRLNGNCGHQAIIHQPEGGKPHVDFVVNGKVECYEGVTPPGPCAMWPSRYNCEELDCPGGSTPHKLSCECEQECKIQVGTAPKEFQLSEIDFNDKEWDQEFFHNNAGAENSLAGLIGLQLGSEDGNATL